MANRHYTLDRRTLDYFRTVGYFYKTDQIYNRITGAGTGSDKNSYVNWYPESNINFHFNLLELLYKQNPIAKKIVDIVADDMFSGRIFTDLKQRVIAKQLDTAYETLGFNHKIVHALKMARVYGGAVILIVTDDIKNKEDLLRPLTNVNTLGLKNLLVFERVRYIPNYTIITDIWDENYGRPMFYYITDNRNLSTIPTPLSFVQVHHSRIIEVMGRDVDYDTYRENIFTGDSVYRSMENSLKNYATCIAALTTAMQESNIDVVSLNSVNTSQSIKGGDAQMRKTASELSLQKSNYKTMILGKDERLERQGFPTLAGLNETISVLRTDIAMSANISVSKLFGLQTQGLAADRETEMQQDAKYIRNEQDRVLKPIYNKIDKLLLQSLNLPAVLLQWKFSDVTYRSEKQIQETTNVLVNSISNLVQQQIIDREVARNVIEQMQIMSLSIQDRDRLRENDELIMQNAQGLEGDVIPYDFGADNNPNEELFQGGLGKKP